MSERKTQRTNHTKWVKKLITLLTVAVMICGSAIVTVAAPLPLPTTALVNPVTPHYLPGSVEYLQLVPGGPIQTAGDYATFKKLVQDNTTTTIYLTADIVQTKSDYAPIALKKANSKKPLLVIDGNGFTITEYSGATTGGFIAFKLDKTVTAVTVQNLIIKGFNRDGFIRAEDTNKVERVVTFDNVTYTGRSIADLASASGHVGETLILKDCVIESSKAAGTTINRQVGDAHNIILEGTIQIKRDNNVGASDNYGIFRVRGDYLTVKSGAVVNIVNDTVGGLDPSALARFEKETKFTVEQDATLNYEGYGPFIESRAADPTLEYLEIYGTVNNTLKMGSHSPVYHYAVRASNITVHEGGVWNLVYQGVGFSLDKGLIYTQNLTVKEGAILRAVAYGNTNLENILVLDYINKKYGAAPTLTLEKPDTFLLYDGSKVDAKKGTTSVLSNAYCLKTALITIKADTVSTWKDSHTTGLNLSTWVPALSPDNTWDVTAKTYTAQLSYKGVFSAASIAGVFNASALATNILSIKGKDTPPPPTITAHLTLAPITTVIANHPARLPIQLTGEHLAGKQAVFTLVNDLGVEVYRYGPVAVSDDFYEMKDIPATVLAIPAGPYTFRVEIVGTAVTDDVPLIVAEDLDSYWTFEIQASPLDGHLTLVAIFDLGGYDTVQVVGSVYLNNVLQDPLVDYIVDGNSVWFPNGPTSGQVKIRFAALRYQNLVPDYTLSLERTVTLP